MSDGKFVSSLSPEEQEKRSQKQHERQLKALSGLSNGAQLGCGANGDSGHGGDEGGGDPTVAAEAQAFLQGEAGLSTAPEDLAPFEEKWGFTHPELQSAVKVVSTLFSNPSLYVGDPYLAESRLYTMITRDRRAKKEHRDSFKQIMNEEKKRRDKMKRVQDLETIRKTTMKREREDALNQLLLAGDEENEDLGDDGEDGRGDRAHQLLIQQRQLRMLPTSGPLAIKASASSSSAVAEEQTNEDGPTGSGDSEIAQHKRSLAAFELMETVYNVASLNELASNDGRVSLTPQAVQDWRCHLTSAYHRFVPTLPFGTQMVHCLPVGDHYGQQPALIPTTAQHCHAILHASQRLLLGLRVFAEKAGTTTSPTTHTTMIEMDCVKSLSLSLKELLVPARQYRPAQEGTEQMGVVTTNVSTLFSSWKVGGDQDDGVVFGGSSQATSHFSRTAERLSFTNGTLLTAVLNANLASASTGVHMVSASSLRGAYMSACNGVGASSPATLSLHNLLQVVANQCNQLQSTPAFISHGTAAMSCVTLLATSLPQLLANDGATTHAISASQVGTMVMGLLSLLTLVTESHSKWREDAAKCQLDDNTDDGTSTIDEATFHASYMSALANPAHPTNAYGLFLDATTTSLHRQTAAEEDGNDHNTSPSPYPTVTLQRLSDTVAAVVALVLYTSDVDDTITKGSPKVFNGVRLASPPAAPEADSDGTIPNEEGTFEEEVDDSGSVVFPYQDAMLFVTSQAATTPSSSSGHQGDAGGVLMMLNHQTSMELKMNRVQKCHTCKGKYSFLHPFYYSLCRPCGEFNYNKRLMTRDLTGKVVLLTGCRIKIGFAMALSLLRCGATLIGTTRFSVDAMGRFSEEPDYDVWKHRLHLYTIDLRDMWLVTEFCAYIGSKFPKMFAIINNAAQTIARTPAYTAELRRLEAQPPAKLRERLDKDADATAWYHYYHANSSVIVGRSLTLEHHPVANPVLHDDLGIDKNAEAATNAAATSSSSPSGRETPAELEARLRKDGGDGGALTSHLGGDALGKAVAQRYDRYDTYAEESDKRAQNTWTMNMAEVDGSEAAEVMAINALSPFILNAKLKPLLMNRCGEEPEDTTAEPEVISHSARKAGAERIGKFPSSARFIINVSAMEGQFYRHKQTTHPHTNMAKAALNMMTRTSAEDYAKDGIFMNSVDTGWITDESPAEKKKHRAQESMLCPLDEVDAAARCLDLIYTDSREFGKFYKNFTTISW